MADMSRDQVLAMRLRSRAEDVRDTLARVREALAAMGLGAERRGLVELVLAEALNNVVEHAYRARPAGEIELSIDLGAERIDMVILDRGMAMPGHALPRGAPADPMSLPEGGFGWHLIRELTDRLVYLRRSGENRLELGISLRP